MKLSEKKKELIQLAGLELDDAELDRVSGGSGSPSPDQQSAGYQSQYDDIRRLIDELSNPQTSYARIRAIKQEMHDKYSENEDLIRRVIDDKFSQ